MKQITKMLVAAGIIISLFIVACNKNIRLESNPDNISNSVILDWNELAYETMGGPANMHSLLGWQILCCQRSLFNIITI